MNSAVDSLDWVTGEPVSDADYRRVSEFLYREGDLLSRQAYDAWLTLLAPDITYRVPLQQFTKRGEARTYGGDPAWLDETHESLVIRVKQLLDAASNARKVSNFMRYFITNIYAAEVEDGLRVASQVLILRVRANNPQPFLLSGARRDRLVRYRDSLLLAEREVRIDMPRIDSPNLAFFI